MVIGLLGAGGCAAAPAEDPRPASDATLLQRQAYVTSARLDSVRLHDLNGESHLVRFTSAGPTVLLIFDEQDCLSCVNLGYEAWQAHHWVTARGGRVLGIVAGRDRRIPAEYARRTRLPFAIMVDTVGWAERTFGMALHPIMAMLAPDGTVLSTVVRTTRITEARLMPTFLASWNSLLPVREHLK